MVFIQFLIIALSAFVISRIILSFRRNKIGLKGLLFWLLIWSTILTVVLLPKTTGLLAKILGVGRGSDAAVYLSLVLIFYFIFRIFVRLEKIESDITAIVRGIALKDKDNRK
ncbi:MAG: DUF2304 family protein [Candidatus Nealsonbacteria bacterium]|nr:DUF2304 family protein [Candidatus Nealsonbacteria bacterium]